MKKSIKKILYKPLASLLIPIYVEMLKINVYIKAIYINYTIKFLCIYYLSMVQWKCFEV